MGEPARKLAFRKSTGDWLVVEDAGNGASNIVETLDADPSNWTGDAYNLASAHPKASVELKDQLDWYRGNMLDEPSGPLDENGKTTATPAPTMAQPANDNAQRPAAAPAPANDNAIAPSTSWSSLANVAMDKIFGGNIFGNGERVTEPVTSGLPSQARQKTRGFSDAPIYRDDGTDFMRGLGQGATLRFGDELAGGLEGALSLTQTGTPGAQRRASRDFDAPLMTASERVGAATDEAIDRNRADNAASQERSPYAYGAGELTGAGSVAALTAPVAAAGTPWTAMVAPNAAQGAALGYLTGYGGSEGDSRLSDAATGAGVGALGGAGATMLGAGAGRVAKVVGDDVDRAVDAAKELGPMRWMRGVAEEQAPRFRLASVGPYGSQIKKIMQREGFDYTERDLGNAIEAAYPAERGALGLPKLRQPRDFAKLARPRMEQAGAEIDEALAAMDEQGVTAPVRNTGNPHEVAVTDAIDAELSKYGSAMRIGDDDKVMRAALRAKRMQALEAAGENNRLKPTQLAAMKRSLEGSGYATEATAGLPQGVRREAHRVAAAGPRNALRDAAEKQALPETFEAWQRANKEYPLHKTVTELAEGRTAQEQGNQIASLPAAVGTVASGGVGLPFAAAWEGAKRYGADAVAHGMYGTARALTPAVRPAMSAAPAMSRAAATAAVPGNTWTALAHAGQTAAAQDAPPPADSGRAPQVEIGEAVIKPRTQQSSGEGSHGHMNVQMVRYALKVYPNALGQFKEQLKSAEQGDPLALSSTVADLQRTSPDFRRVLEELAAQEERNRKHKELR